VETKGLSYTPVVTGVAYNAGAISTLPGSPVVASGHGTTTGTDNSTITPTQTSATTFSAVSNNPEVGDFTFGQVSWGYFNSSNVFVGTGGSLGTSVTLALNGTVGKVLKVEFLNTLGVKKVFLVTLGATHQNFTFDLTGFTTTMAAINFVSDQVGTTNYTVETKGLSYVPTVPMVSPTPGLTAGDISHLAGLLNLVAFNSQAPDPTATVTTSPISTTQFNINYNVTNSASYGGSISTFDNFSTGPKEYVNLSALTQIVLGLRFQSGDGSVEFVVEDASGAKAKVLLTGVGTTEQFYSINKALLTGINWSQISNIVVVVANANVTQKIGALEVRFGDNYYVPYTAGTAYDYAALTSFGTYYPTLVAGSGNTVVGEPEPLMQLTQNSTNEFEYQYDLSPSSTGFTFVSITRGGTAVYRLPTTQYIFAARGTDGERVKVEITDGDGDKATFMILLTSTLQNFTLNLPANIDRLRIKEIVFVQDQNLGSPLLNDFVKIQTKGLSYVATSLPEEMVEIREDLIEKGLDYFDVGAGVDPVTHFPYDNRSSTGVFAHFTQPTLIGFYAQLLGDVVNGSLSNGMSVEQALIELNAVMDNLQTVQTNHGWNGLIPWMDLNTGNPANSYIGFLDNANMAQSLAVMIGALQGAVLSGTDLTRANTVIAKTEAFLNAQTAGYQAFVDRSPASGGFGLFRMSYDRSTGQYSSYIDRLASEVRGAVAFIQVRYPDIPRSVWDDLKIETTNYTDRNGNVIENVMAWDGAAFQMFWPSLRNDERSFIGFRNMLYNQLISQMDWAAQNNLPGSCRRVHCLREDITERSAFRSWPNRLSTRRVFPIIMTRC
jgi:hypothetical protein